MGITSLQVCMDSSDWLQVCHALESSIVIYIYFNPDHNLLLVLKLMSCNNVTFTLRFGRPLHFLRYALFYSTAIQTNNFNSIFEPECPYSFCPKQDEVQRERRKNV